MVDWDEPSIGIVITYRECDTMLKYHIPPVSYILNLGRRRSCSLTNSTSSVAKPVSIAET